MIKIDASKRPDFIQKHFADLNSQRVVSIALPFIAMYSSKTSAMISAGIGVYQCYTLWTTTNAAKYSLTIDLVLTATLGYFSPTAQLAYSTLKFSIAQYQRFNQGKRAEVALQTVSHAIYLHSIISGNPSSIVLSLLPQATSELVQAYTHYYDDKVNRTPEIIANILLASIRLHKVSTTLPQYKQYTPATKPTNTQEPPAPVTKRRSALSAHPTSANSPSQSTWYKQVLKHIPKSSYLQQEDAGEAIDKICKEGEQLCRTFEGDASQLFHDTEFSEDRDDVKLGMPGVAMIATYLKEKHQLDHLYVCSSLEAFQQKLEEISHSLADIRAALVIPWDFMGRATGSEKYIGDAGHKLAVCVEKKADLMKVAIIDSLGGDSVDTQLIQAPAERLVEEGNTLNTVLWYIYHSTVDLSKAEIYYCEPEIQQAGFGCETFALRAAVSFLRYPSFFDRIITVKENTPVLPLRKITHLPLLFLKGVQSRGTLLDLIKQYLEQITPRPPVRELADLYNRFNKHFVEVNETMRNYYINRRSHKYHQMVLTACKILSGEKIAQILKQTLLTDARAPAPERPRTPSDCRLPQYTNRSI